MIQVTVEPTLLTVGRASELTVAIRNRGEAPCVHLVFCLTLPETFVQLSGSTRIEADLLSPGETRTLRVEVRPRREGEWSLTSRNFAYRDASGLPRRVRDFERLVLVDSAPAEEPASPPCVFVTLATEQLPLGEWSTLRGSVAHRRGPEIERLWVRVTGRIEDAAGGDWREVPGPVSPEGTAIAFQVRGMEAGDSVPVAIEARFRDAAGREHAASVRRTLQVRSEAAVPGNEVAAEEVTRILMLCANPSGSAALQLGPEARDLEDEVRRSKHRDRLCIRVRNAVRHEDVLREILEVKPQILHFSGHGDTRGFLYLEDALGGASLVSADAMTSLAALVEGTLQCAVLNACFSVVQARAMARHVPYVIGMSRQIRDDHARQFTLGFYMALGAGESVERAFRYGCQLIQMKSGHGHDVPRLLCRELEVGSREPSSEALRP